MIAGFRHFGITVRDLDRALDFYCRGLQFVLDRRFERPASYTENVTGVGGTALRAALIRWDDHIVELLEYKDRDDRPESAPAVHHPGAAHLCVQVPSIETAMQELVRCGACFGNEAVTVPSGPGSGNRVLYGRDPEGIPFELVEIKKTVGRE